MIKITDKSKCCGCTACASVCVHDAISMQPDALGFMYPVVDESKCVDCGLCDKVCAFNEHYDTSLNFQLPAVYAVRHKNPKEIETSRSGAAFIAISDYVLDNGGVVYGAGFGDNFKVLHKRADSKSQRDEFKGSKYVQSDLRGVFRQVKKDLQDKKTVLFSGTPCQTAGLDSYIGRRLRNNLILVDVVCHGVPGPYIWNDYMSFMEKKEKSKIISASFRDKSHGGWSSHFESFGLEFGKVAYSSDYASLFLSNVMLRHSCYMCPYANLRRPSDITLGDFWGWQKTDAYINADNMGVSLVLLNTPKGKDIFEKVKTDINYVMSDTEKCLQPNLLRPSAHNELRDRFECEYKKHGFDFVIKKYLNLIRWRKKMASMVNFIRNIIRKK